ADQAAQHPERRCGTPGTMCGFWRRGGAKHLGEPSGYRKDRRRTVHRSVDHLGLVDAAGPDEIPAVASAPAADVDAVPGQLAAAGSEGRPLGLPVVEVAPFGGPDRKRRLEHLADGRGERREGTRPVLVDAEQAAPLAGDAEVPRAVCELGLDEDMANRGKPGP